MARAPKRRLARIGWSLAGGIGLVVALLATLMLALPYLGPLREPVIGWMTETLDRDVELGRVTLGARGLRVRLVLGELTVRDPVSGRAQFAAHELTLDLDVPATLLARAPRIKEVRLDRAQLTVHRRPDGALTVAGLERLVRENRAARDYFLARGRLQLRQTELRWSKAEDIPLPSVTLLSLDLRNRGDRHHLSLAGRPLGEEATQDGQIRLAADLQGSPTRPERWSGAVLFATEGMALGPLITPHFGAFSTPPGATADLLGRGDLQEGRLEQLRGQVALRSLAAGDHGRLSRVAAWLDWRREPTGWRTRIPALSIAQGRQIAYSTGIEVRAAGRQLTATLARLDLALLSQLAGLLPVPGGSSAGTDDLRAYLSKAQLGGQLEDLAVRLRRADGVHRGSGEWQARARLVGIEALPAADLPGVTGLNGTVIADHRSGLLRFTGTDPRVRMPKLFRAPIALERLAGEIVWGRGSRGALRVVAPRLRAANQDLHTMSRLDLLVPGTRSGTGHVPRLRLQTHFRDGQAAAIRRYLPVGVLHPKLVRWLDRAFPTGQIPRGDLLFEGPLGRIPRSQAEGRFEVIFDVRNLELDYHRDWPPLRDASGRLRFLNRALEIDLAHARMLNTELGPVAARIPRLGRATRVAICGRGDGPFQDGLTFIRETPLAKRAGHLSGALTAEGPAHLELALSLPIGRPGRPGLDGEISWPGHEARIAVAGTPLVLSDLAGRLHLSPRGIETDAVTGRLWGEATTLTITPEPGADATLVVLDGETAVADLSRHLPSPAWSAMTGRLPWEVTIALPPAESAGPDRPPTWHLSSDLLGLALDLPPPFGKAGQTAKPFELSGKGDPRVTPEPLRARFGQAAALLERAPNATQPGGRLRAAIGLGGEPPALPAGAGMRVGGALDELDLPAWLAWLEARAQQAAPLGEDLPPLRSADLRLRRLLLGGLTIENLNVQADRRAQSWELQLDSPAGAGTLSLPDDARSAPAVLALRQLDLASLLEQARSAGRGRATSGAQPNGVLRDPRHMRPFVFEVEQLSWRGRPLGQLEARAQAHREGLAIDPILFTGPLAQISGTGRWRSIAAGATRSELELDGEADALGELLAGLGHFSVLEKAPASARLRLSWPGGPTDLDLAAVTGRLRFELGPGQLLEVEPGLGRMLGVLNLGALQRRLALDFSDLYGKGLGFERIDGDLIIGNGLAVIDHLEVEGPAGDISIAGRTNLIERTLDQVVTITPKVSSSVALASAVAGGPLVGAAVYVADQVAGGAVDKLSRYQYRVSGPWGEPVFTRRDRWGPLSMTGQDETGGGDSGTKGDGSPSESAGEEPPNLFLDAP